ncbi:hypothetical protein BU24DRAFT_421129 [Aaosphaeria arxii CBS 175.79]|uniref:YCII-related domain-containing protein n=1 Tax=Aaosphaeria arxii CBS 175.79 TaxID=1450172 RepID=A0A6A5XYT4_9PLEO|nr:uncharacterized protein BU24DRAFT_421129 [Aaosphaeria arxii CBS 175.79]KAF2018129.1 hypothetical protein BU24DRAFT_421129 [Aaosphaeria arxii CBS 175.79]
MTSKNNDALHAFQSTNAPPPPAPHTQSQNPIEQTINSHPSILFTPPTGIHTYISMRPFIPRATTSLLRPLTSPRPSILPFAARTKSPFTISLSSSSAAQRTMAPGASSTLQEWLVIAPDFEGALEKRLKVRNEHLGGLKADPDSFWLWGGAMLEEPIKEGETPKMKGSAMLIGASSREEVIERLKKDPYVAGGVWDLEKVQIIPFKSALRKAL